MVAAFTVLYFGGRVLAGVSFGGIAVINWPVFEKRIRESTGSSYLSKKCWHGS